MRRSLLLWLLLPGLLATGCTPEPQVHQRRFFAFGTLIDLNLVAADPQQADAAMTSVEDLFQHYHQQWHPWYPGPLTRLNAALASGASITPDPSLAELIQKATPLASASGYRFDPGIGQLVSLWGFHSDIPPAGPPPATTDLEAWRQKPASLADLHWRQGQVFSSNPKLQLDFGAFAKGYAVDLAIARLRAMGIDNAIVNAGGDLRAIGQRPDRPWRIGIRHPRNDRVLAWIEIREDESVFTSGDYERFYEYEGQRYHHILDPQQGVPAREVTSVTVIHPQAARADAAATALFVAGPAHWREVARTLDITQVLLIDAEGTAHLTGAMQARLHFEQTPERLQREDSPP